MAPRKKPNSSSSSASSASKKSNPNNQPQPSKFGIQHFFERHTQNALLASQNPKQSLPSDDVPSSGPVRIEKSVLTVRNPKNELISDSKDAVLASRDIKRQTKEPNVPSQNTPPENLVMIGVNDAENLSEVSPEISKSVSLKRFKFSPGMVNPL